MRKKIGRILFWFFGILLLLFTIFAIVLYLNREEIKLAVLTEVNEILAEPVEVKKVDVSLRKFPYASLVFDEVFSKGAGGGNGDTLLYAQKIYFEFNLWNVFSKNLSIHRISLENGTAHIIRPEEGIPNYQVWKTDSLSSSSSLFTLDEVTFQNFRLFQYEGAIDQSTRGHIHQLSFSGSFDSENFSIQNQGALYIDSLKLESRVYLQKVEAKVAFNLNGNTKASHITDGSLQIEDVEVDFAINIEPDGVSILATKKGADLKSMQHLANSQNWGAPENLSVAGKADLNFKGVFEDNQPPHVEVNFTTHGARLSGYENANIRDFSCQGSYRLQNERGHVRLSRFSGKGRTGGFEGSLDINDLSRPGVVLDLKSDLELSEWLIFVPADTITKPEGRATIDVHFENQFKSLSNIQPEELKRARASGSFRLEGIGFTFKNSDRRVNDLNAELRFLGNDLKVSSFSFRTGSSDIYLEGVFENVLNYAYFKDQKLKVDTRLRSEQMVMEDFILSGTTGSEEDYSLEFAKSLDLELELRVDGFAFDKFRASDIRGRLLVKNGVIKAESISLAADDGTFNGNLTIDTRPAQYQLKADLTASSINMHKLFESFRNFGQDAIVAENLYGTANLNLDLEFATKPNLEVDLSSINMKSHLKIENGNLKNYEPMLALSRFADIKELQDVKFSVLENDISIRNSQVIIPMMNINSNVLDMGLQGRHGFDNIIDYSIRLKLSDVLFSNRKDKNRKSEFDEHLVVVERGDDPNIYVKMTGPILDPLIELDRQELNKSINRDIKEQGRELKDIFKKKEKEEKKDDAGIKFDLFGDEKDQ